MRELRLNTGNWEADSVLLALVPVADVLARDETVNLDLPDRTTVLTF